VEKWVLVISSQPAFGDLIKISLAENIEYQVQSAYQLEDLQKIDLSKPLDLMIIDVDLNDQNWITSIQQLQSSNPSMKTIVFPSGITDRTLIQQQVNVDSFFEKPFYLPKFLKEIKILFAMDGKNEDLYPGINREVVFTLSLEELIPSLEYILNKCDAKQIIYYVKDLPYASTGNLGDFVTLEISSFLESRRQYPQHVDLVRYKRFIGDSNNYLIYIKSISESDKLVMVFDGQVPLEKAKSQINSVMKFLKDPTYYRTMENGDLPKMATSLEGDSDALIAETPVNSQPDSLQNLDIGNIKKLSSDESEIMTLDALVADSQEDHFVDTQKSEASSGQVNDKEAGQDQTLNDFSLESGILTHDFLSDWINEAENWETETQLKEDISDSKFSNVIEEHTVQEYSPKDNLDLTDSLLINYHANAEKSKVEDQKGDELNFLAEITFPWDEEKNQIKPAGSDSPGEALLSDTKPITKSGMNIIRQSISIVENPLDSEKEPQSSIPPEDPLGKTQPRKTTVSNTKDPVLPESHSVGHVNLSYTFLLIPRFPSHYLTNNLAKKLADWIQNLCLAFGWRLDRMTIRPLYLSWSIIAPPTIAPNKIIARIRKETSKRIMKDLPFYFQENPSNDFWAPGYLLMNENFSPSKTMVTEYIKQTRRYQGLSVTPKI
jgi:REP element-mobilizing transposase RayT/CheY-like chemotaxis protein